MMMWREQSLAVLIFIYYINGLKSWTVMLEKRGISSAVQNTVIQIRMKHRCRLVQHLLFTASSPVQPLHFFCALYIIFFCLYHVSVCLHLLSLLLCVRAADYDDYLHTVLSRWITDGKQRITSCLDRHLNSLLPSSCHYQPRHPFFYWNDGTNGNSLELWCSSPSRDLLPSDVSTSSVLMCCCLDSTWPSVW